MGGGLLEFLDYIDLVLYFYLLLLLSSKLKQFFLNLEFHIKAQVQYTRIILIKCYYSKKDFESKNRFVSRTRAGCLI